MTVNIHFLKQKKTTLIFLIYTIGQHRGFAFVTFDDYDAVDKAVLEKPHVINGRNLDVKKAVPKEKMQEVAGTNKTGGGAGGMPPFNRNNPSNYSGPDAGPPPPPQSGRNNFGGPSRDNFNAPSGSWDNQAGMSRMNNQNQNFNQPSPSSYGQQGGYNANASGFNPPMPPSNAYPQSFNPMGQNQPPPPPPPPLPQQSSMMNYDMYNTSSNMPFNNNPNQPPSSNYMQPPPMPYGQNQQQGFGNNADNFGSMNNPFNAPPAPTGGNRGYNNPSSTSTSTPFDNSNSYGITSQNYGGGYNNNMPQQQSRGGGPMRGGRG